MTVTIGFPERNIRAKDSFRLYVNIDISADDLLEDTHIKIACPELKIDSSKPVVQDFMVDSGVVVPFSVGAYLDHATGVDFGTNQTFEIEADLVCEDGRVLKETILKMSMHMS